MISIANASLHVHNIYYKRTARAKLAVKNEKDGMIYIYLSWVINGRVMTSVRVQ